MVGSTIIIAEIGVNHNGSMDLAKEMILEAKCCGADIVKFQTAELDSLVTRDAPQAEYQIKNMGNSGGQKNMLSKLLFTFEQFEELNRFAKENAITFLSTPFDCKSIDFLDKLNMPFWKIPSGEITNYPYLVRIANTKKKVVMSTGMCTIQDIEEAVQVLKLNGTTDIVLLQCNTQYPTRMEDVNLRAMKTLKERFGVEVGYSDHTEGIEAAVAATALGARIIEKHFTLDREMEGPDHKASIEPKEFKEMVRMIRNIEKALGSAEKYVSRSEKANVVVARKSIVAKTKIQKGEVFSEDNVTTKRPGCGLSPMQWNDVIGKTASHDFEVDEMIEI